jgi:FkbM family methyltransferase
MFTLCASHLVGSAGKVISFEPNPTSRKLLERELNVNRISNVRVLPYGASNSSATLTLNVPLSNSGEATFGEKNMSENSFYKVESQVVTADSQLVGEKPAMIKIDVEGFECSVIEGLTATLKKHTPVVFTEVVDAHLKACGASSDKLIMLLSSLGYVGYCLKLKRLKHQYIWNLEPVVNDNTSYNAVWLHKNSTTLAANSILRRVG